MIDEIKFIFIVWTIVLSPTLLALVWIWFTQLPTVKRRLRCCVMLAICGPFVYALSHAFFRTICKHGTGIDTDLTECGLFPDWAVEEARHGYIVFVVGFGAYAIIRSAYEEIRNYRSKPTCF